MYLFRRIATAPKKLAESHKTACKTPASRAVFSRGHWRIRIFVLARPIIYRTVRSEAVSSAASRRRGERARQPTEAE